MNADMYAENADRDMCAGCARSADMYMLYSDPAAHCPSNMTSLHKLSFPSPSSSLHGALTSLSSLPLSNPSSSLAPPFLLPPTSLPLLSPRSRPRKPPADNSEAILWRKRLKMEREGSEEAGRGAGQRGERGVRSSSSTPSSCPHLPSPRPSLPAKLRPSQSRRGLLQA